MLKTAPTWQVEVQQAFARIARHLERDGSPPFTGATRFEMIIETRRPGTSIGLFGSLAPELQRKRGTSQICSTSSKDYATMTPRLHIAHSARRDGRAAPKAARG